MASLVKTCVPRSFFIEFSCFLNLKHQITSIDILHHKKQSILKTKQTKKLINEQEIYKQPHVLFCLLQKRTNNNIFDDFPKIFNYFSKNSEVCPKVVQRPHKRLQTVSKNFLRLSKKIPVFNGHLYQADADTLNLTFIVISIVRALYQIDTLQKECLIFLSTFQKIRHLSLPTN